MKILTTWLSAATLALIIAAAAAAQQQTPHELVRETSAEVMRVLREQNEQVRNDPQFVRGKIDEIIFPLVDLEAMGKLILGRYWLTATPEQRERFIAEFRNMLVRTYTGSVAEYADTEINVLPPRGPGDIEPVTVYTEIAPEQGKPVPVSFKFRMVDGGWKAYDLVIEGLSMVKNYRTSFTSEISQTSLDALIERLSNTNSKGTDQSGADRSETGQADA